MDLGVKFLLFLAHLDRYLAQIVGQYGSWTYAVLFAIVFLETGLVITPFLPGDSLLFAAGALAGIGVLRLDWLWLIFFAAAVLGDTVNYHIGYYLGGKIPVKKEYLARTHAFYERYGGKTIILARFVPVVRTFAPFVAGVGRMNYWRFLAFNISGGFIWTAIFLWAGYWFGNWPVVQRNFSLFIVVIVIVSLLPALIEYLRHHKQNKP